MAKRLHPKTIEERIHQILCMDQDPEQSISVNNKKCYLQLNVSKDPSSRTVSNTKYLPYNNNVQRIGTANVYQRYKCRTNGQTIQQQQQTERHVCSNM